MIIEIFILFLIISLSFVLIGYFTQAPPVQIIGYGFIFILGFIIMFGSLQYKSGETEVYTYGANFTTSVHWDELHPYEYPSFNPSEDPIYLFHKNITNTYTEFNEETVANINIRHFFGLFLAVSGIFGFVSVMLNLNGEPKKKKKGRYEYEEDD